jgi:hypothetical protein
MQGNYTDMITNIWKLYILNKWYFWSKVLNGLGCVFAVVAAEFIRGIIDCLLKLEHFVANMVCVEAGTFCS